MARNVYGLDLGSYEIKVYDKKRDTIWKEKDVIALKNGRDIFAVGDDAFLMYEKSPSNIEVVFPMKEGVISRFHDMQFLLQNLLKKDRQFARGSEYVVAVPTDVTEVEKKAFFDLVIHSTAKAKEVNIVERSIADAIGLNLDVQNTKGVFIVNFGGETTELSVIAGGGMVMNRLLKIGGVTFDQAIINLVRHSHDFLIGRHTAEVLRKSFGIFTSEIESMLTAAGRDLITGVPMRKGISINLVRLASLCLTGRRLRYARLSTRTGSSLRGVLRTQPGLRCMWKRWSGSRPALPWNRISAQYPGLRRSFSPRN